MKLVFATHNSNKIKEIEPLLPEFIELVSLTDLGCDEEIREDGETLEENAYLKASYVTKNFKLDVFADDTGLEVEELNGAPGVYSARYAGKDHDSEANMKRLLKMMEGKTNRKAQFKTVIALNLGTRQKLFIGICKGSILKEARGDQGFGYDPVFQPEGFDKSFAEMTQEEKNKISHRAKAFHKLIGYLHSQLSA